MEFDAARPEPGSVTPTAVPVADWEELRKLAEKQAEADDAMIASVLQEALMDRAGRLLARATAKPAWVESFPALAALFADLEVELPAPQAAALESEITSSAPNDPETAERWIREAHIWSMRGDKAKAKELLDRAEQAAPSSAVVLAALGEAALERRNLKEAVRLFGLAKDADPGNVAIEKRHADAVFQEKAKGMFFDPTAMSASETAAGAKSAMLMSVLLPGLGQVVTGEVGKGFFLMAMVVGGWITSVLIGFKGLFAILGLGASKDANALVLLPLGIAVLFHMIAIFDAAARAKTVSRRKIDRPVPPSNLPFE